MSKEKIWPPWHKECCSKCGNEALVTRGDSMPAYDYVCEVCEVAARDYATGYKAGYKEGLAQRDPSPSKVSEMKEEAAAIGPRHPIQPTIEIRDVLRFKKNEIVGRLLDEGGIDLNQIAMWDVSREDREQFAQLIGYSLSGFADLSYTSAITVKAAVLMSAKGITDTEARLQALEQRLQDAKEGMVEGVAELFSACVEDLMEED